MNKQPSQSIRELLHSSCTFSRKGILVSFSYPGTAPYVAVFYQYSDLCKFIDEHPDMSVNVISVDIYE